jgi:putative SOS response-associated peptidase YedK
MNVHDHQGIQQLLDSFGLSLQPERFAARHNIAPGAELFTIYHADGPQLAEMEWGIVPPWAKPGKFSGPLINARSETIWEKPSFKKQVARTRTIIPVNGFYEWKRSKDTKIPYYFTARDVDAMGLAGIYQVSKDGVMQCCVITTAANELMSEIHNRMPVILSQEAMQQWLVDDDRQALDKLMVPAPEQALERRRVSKYVNNARNEGPECIEPDESDSG